MRQTYCVVVLLAFALSFFLVNLARAEEKGRGCDCGTVDFHTGVDLNAPAGTPIQAEDDGVVVKVEGNEQAAVYSSTGGFCGRYIVLRHDYKNGRSVFTRYAQLGAIADKQGRGIKEGQKIKAGERIGTIGKAGLLHFEVRPVASKPNTETSLLYKDDPTMAWTKYQPVNPDDFDFDRYAGRQPKKQ